MKTIYVKAQRVFTSSIVSSHRTSNGWIYDEEEVTRCEIWMSEPVCFQSSPVKVLSHINQKYYKRVYIDDSPCGYNPDRSDFSPEWTKEICLLLNFALSDNTYEFREWNELTAVSCNFQLVSNLCKYSFQGKCVGEDGPHNSAEYSPFASVAELKHAIASLYNTGNKVPFQWLRYLIANSTEDLSDFILEHNIEVDSCVMRICNGEGELFPSIANYSCPSIEYFLKWKPDISYIDACKEQDSKAISYYQRYGADSSIEERYKPRIYEYEEDPYDAYEQHQAWLQTCQDELDSWEEGWEWNVD